ncbi:hypothetical protein VNO77_21914 [Canavalia gladiata]|uniref:Rx N-terminal domain-containing protein n=1 Tax=Canavalia gladiata TaxID=3824 RepID=A0AAN9L1T4_CANGL
MAGAVVGQAFLSAFLDVVFDRLASPEVANFIRRNKLDHDLLQRLKTTLYAVEAVLNDAELKQIKNSAVNRWLVDLKDAVYEADDLLDRVSTQAATPKEASNFFSRFLNFQEREMVAKLEDTVGRLDSIFKLKDILGLKENASDNLSWRSPSTSLEEGSKIYGRDKDKEAILKLLLDDDKNDGEISVIPIVETKVGVRTRHLSFSMLSDPLSENFDVFGRLKFLRTFLPVDLKESPFHNEEAARLILLNLKYVRVLSFRKFSGLDALPDSIGELIHLRYLNLTYTSIKTLPESIGKLYNLQTLKLSGCEKLTVLPNGMQNLIHLRRLDLRLTGLEEMPRGMGKLNDLQHLSDFIVGKDEGKGIKGLGKLSNLEGSLFITKIENVANSREAMEGRVID